MYVFSSEMCLELCIIGRCLLFAMLDLREVVIVVKNLLERRKN